jgi:hypothetical protein
MPPVRDLHRLLCPGRGLLGGERCLIAADNLRPWPFHGPSGQAGRLSLTFNGTVIETGTDSYRLAGT